MYSHHQQHQQPSFNASGQEMPGFCFSNPADPAPEFSSINQTLCHQPLSTNSFDFYELTSYSNNNNDIYTKPQEMNYQQPLFPSEIPFMGIQNYLSSVSYQNMPMMAAPPPPPPPTAIPASPLSSAFSSSSSPPMDDFLSMDHHATPLAEFENNHLYVSPPQPFSPIHTATTTTPTRHTTSTKKREPLMIQDATMAKKKQKKEKKSMVPVLGEFFCDFEGCGKVFGRKYNLSSHLVTHYAQRKFFCDHCPKAFVRRHDLKRHMRIHTGETPHKCLYCDRGFGRADALQRHYLTDATCTVLYNNDPLRNRFKKKARSTGFGAKA